MFESFVNVVDKVLNFFENDRKENEEKWRKKNAARLEQRASEMRKKEREEIKRRNQEAKENNAKQRRTFTTIEEYKKIAGAKLSALDRLPQHERDVVAQRVQKLCKEDEKFRKGLMNWAKQGYEIPKKSKSAAHSNKSHQGAIEI